MLLLARSQPERSAVVREGVMAPATSCGHVCIVASSLTLERN